jgi:xanthine dehydrogenase YagT iron-sulfur-binding subunit
LAIAAFRETLTAKIERPVMASTFSPVTLTINGSQCPLMVEPRRTLLDALRHDLGLTGTKKVCDAGSCGACTVIVDGRAMYSCLLLAIDCEGREITTIEGLARGETPPSGGDSSPWQGEAREGAPGHGGETLDPLQQAFVERDAFQCGFCTAGQLMSLHALLEAQPRPTDRQIERAVTGNLCRCGAYPNILAAGRLAADLRVTVGQRNG